MRVKKITLKLLKKNQTKYLLIKSKTLKSSDHYQTHRKNLNKKYP